MSELKRRFQKVQDVLNFKGCKRNPQFIGNGIGKIGTAGFLLGLAGGIHLGLWLALVVALTTVELNDLNKTTCLVCLHWSTYFVLLASFHFGEFFVTAVKQPRSLSYDSYIINHSLDYTLAALCSWAEFWIESLIFGRWKHQCSIISIGILLTISGQVIRSLGMWTCGEHFSHIIMDEKRPQHKLVTDGIYRYLRHPAYFGWFYWAIGTQLLLCNPLCTIAYTYASWRFFSARIPYEEKLLAEFYPEEYPEYAHNTVIGIPFIPSSTSITAAATVTTGTMANNSNRSGNDDSRVRSSS